MNHFARFGFEPKPSIDLDALKERFLAQCAAQHPDKAADKSTAEGDFQELNRAYNVLRNSRERLLHLLELSGGSGQQQIQEVPPVALEFFSDIAACMKRADALLKEKNGSNSPMLKVQLMQKGLEEIDAMQSLQGRISSSIKAVEDSLLDLNGEWSRVPSEAAMKRAREAAAALGFLERWNAQLQQRIGELTF